MHNPCFCTYIGHGVKKGLYQGSKMVEPLVFPDLVIREAAIVMRMEPGD